MRPKTITVTSSNSPKLIPLDYRSPATTVDADVTGTINYDVAYTAQNIYDITTPATNAHWNTITNMSGATADQAQVVDASVNCLKVTVNSGSGSVAVTYSQADSV
jgi:hypothetical protein